MLFRFCPLFFQFLILDKLYGIAEAMFGDHVKDASEAEFPFAVSVRFLSNTEAPGTDPKHRCTATLITRKDIITVSHCLLGALLQEISIRWGNRDTRMAAPYIPYWWMHYDEWASYVEIQPAYQLNDIANIRLASMVPHDAHATVGNYTNQIMGGKRVWLAGWSYQQDNTFLTILQKGVVNVMLKTDCDNALAYLSGGTMGDDPRIICTTRDPPITLQPGDTGGPLIYRQTISAINIATCPGAISNRRINMHMGLTFFQDFISYMVNQ